MIDLADPATWPPPVASLVDELAEVIGKHDDFEQGVPMCSCDGPATRSVIDVSPIRQIRARDDLDSPSTFTRRDRLHSLDIVSSGMGAILGG